MDFSTLGNISKAAKPIDPIEIFEKLPNLPGTPNDIWRGQTEALSEWHKNRKLNDVLVALNTGAGKTLVGLLIAQSLVNEGVENVIYVCATKDLVEQTAREAKKVGIDYTTRLSAQHSNDLFESGKAFCITTYQTILNGLKGFIQKYPPGCIIFDDAHVAEAMIRDAFLIKITHEENEGCYKELIELFNSHFAELNRKQQFKAAHTGERPLVMMAAPSGVSERKEQIDTILNKYSIHNDTNLKYVYPNLSDQIENCAVLFSKGTIEITPPFLPSLSIDIFERPIRRIYLSATLKHKSDFIRAFGRAPTKSIEPKNDAGNGERLILLANKVDGGFTPEFANKIAKLQKTIVAVPSYSASDHWSKFAKPPKVENFSESLNDFRKGATDRFVLVSRVDGIDLPHDTCRIMIMDGLPTGSSLIERYQSDTLNMRNAYSLRIANRLVQLFGRINRGRNDYGAFLISGGTLNAWLNNDKNLTLMPNLLQQQIILGRHVQLGKSITTQDKVTEIISTVLSRNPNWLEYYGANIDKNDLDPDYIEKSEIHRVASQRVAEIEAKVGAHLWNGEYDKARVLLEENLEETTRLDPLLGGWHNVWLGGLYERSGDLDSADLAYQRARSRLGTNIFLPIHKKLERTPSEPVDPFAANVYHLIGMNSAELFRKELKSLTDRLKYLDGGTPAQMEEAVRLIGELLGFLSSRPDNDGGTGPDVIWEELSTKKALALELKTDKNSPATYNKKDVGQSHDHIQWVSANKSDLHLIGLCFIGPSGKCTAQANPSGEMWIVEPTKLAQLRDEIIALIKDLRKITPLERLDKTRQNCNGPKWMIRSIFEKLEKYNMLELK